jgi:hypothetical protein
MLQYRSPTPNNNDPHLPSLSRDRDRPGAIYETHDMGAAIAETDRMNSNFADRGIPGWAASATWE